MSLRDLACGWLLFSNALGFGLMAWDKRRARSGGRRVAERTLLLSALTGGALGVFAGQRILRHKTKKQPISSILIAIMMVELLILLTLNHSHNLLAHPV